MPAVRITAVQMQISNQLDENLHRILEHLNKHETEFMVFPEMSLTGRHGGFGEGAVERACEQIAALCRKRYTTAIVGMGHRENGVAYNQARIFSDSGEVLGAQEQLVPPSSERAWCRPGDELRLFEHGELRFGCLIGNDLWVAPGHGPYPDPRLSYRLRERGARLIFHSAQTGNDPAYTAYFESNLRLRAREGGCHIVTANAAVPSGRLNSPTGVVAPDGQWIAVCPLEGEHACHADLDLD
jgi:predicted amidohydrolase